MASMRRAYGVVGTRDGHPVTTPFLAGAGVVVSVSAHHRSLPVAAVAVAIVWAATVRRERGRSLLLLVLLALAALWRGGVANEALVPDRLGPYAGWVKVVDDPQPAAGATRVTVEIEGERFEAWVRGRARRGRVATWRAGEYVMVEAERAVLTPERASRVAWRHVVGEVSFAWVGDVRSGSGVDRASNRVRATIEAGAAVLPGDDGALYRGLVVGDDRDQSSEMIERFRASGLSHLSAVSGQNVAFLLSAAGPLLRALRPWWRWSATLGLIAWFVSLTRFEPSIVRAGAMAAIAATGFVLGRPNAPFRLLAIAVVALVLVDPLLVSAVGFWLSVGATAGVSTIGPWLAGRLSTLGPLSTPLGVTLGAQAGVVLPALLVFGRLPLVSVPANLLAVPVAGFVMLYGLPAGILAGLVPPIAPVVMFPCRVGVRWVDTVATLGERLEPDGSARIAGWALLVAAVAAIAAMNRSRHGSASADRRRRVDPALEGARSHPSTRR
jgi:competence protein ComEC